MKRRRLVALVTCAALLVALPAPGAIAAPDIAAGLTDGRAIGAHHTTDAAVVAPDAPTTRGTNRAIRRALPPARSFGRGWIREDQPGDQVLPCGGRLVGPGPVAGAYAAYEETRLGDATSFMGIEAYRNTGTARQRFRALRREAIRACDAVLLDELGFELRRDPPILRIGQQNWVRSYRERVPAGWPAQQVMVHVYRTGRFVVFAEVFSFTGFRPADFQRPFRRLGVGVRVL
jgi:ketosteroid isomerase-like protein